MQNGMIVDAVFEEIINDKVYERERRMNNLITYNVKESALETSNKRYESGQEDIYDDSMDVWM